MRRLVLLVIALIAIFAIIRSYTEQAPAPAPPRGVELGPGLIEVTQGRGTVSLAFGLMDTESRDRWNVLPLRIVYTSGDRSVSIGLNGLSFLLTAGVRVGRPIQVETAMTGDIVSIGGKVTVDNRVEGDVWTFGADIALAARADVTGNVVAVGGRVTADPRARVAGTLSALPELDIPFLRILATPASATTVELVRRALGFLLSALALFLAAYFMTPHLYGVSRCVTAEWRRTLLSLAVALVALPLLAVLLVLSVFGIFFLPFIFLFVLLAALLGSFAVYARLGTWLRRGGEDSSLFLFTSGILGLFVVSAPAFAGLALALVRSTVAGTIGQILRMVSLGLAVAFLVYGLGSSLSYMRILVKGKAR